MTEAEYYELPYGVGDRIELQNFLISDHCDAIGKAERNFVQLEPLTLDEIIARLITPVIGHLI
jgi:hypothetical protein